MTKHHWFHSFTVSLFLPSSLLWIAPTENVMLKREWGSNVLPKCLFARLSDVWSPWELILPRLRLICFLCCLLKVITSCLEIYKRTAQGEPPPKGVGTEWKMRYTCGRRGEIAWVGVAGVLRENTAEERVYSWSGLLIPQSLTPEALDPNESLTCWYVSSMCVHLSQVNLVEVQLPRFPPFPPRRPRSVQVCLSQLPWRGRSGNIRSSSASQPSLLRAVR